MTAIFIDGEPYADWELDLLTFDDEDFYEGYYDAEDDYDYRTEAALRETFGYMPRIVTLDELDAEDDAYLYDGYYGEDD